MYMFTLILAQPLDQHRRLTFSAPARRRGDSAAPQARRCLAAGGSDCPPLLGSWYPGVNVDIAVENPWGIPSPKNDQNLGFAHWTVGLPEGNQTAHVSHPFWEMMWLLWFDIHGFPVAGHKNLPGKSRIRSWCSYWRVWFIAMLNYAVLLLYIIIWCFFLKKILV